MPYSYNVDGPRYLGIAALKPEFVSQISMDLVKPQDIKSGTEFGAPTVGSYGHGASILIQTMDAYGNPIWENRTANNVFKSYDVPVNKYFSPQVDDGIIRNSIQFPPFAYWKAAGEKDQSREEVVYPQKSINYGLIESFGERQLKVDEGSTKVDLFVHDFSYNGPINDFGKYSHQARNLKQHLMEYYGMKSAQELVSFLKSRGLSMKEIGYLAAGFIPEGAIYSVRKAPDGKAILSAAEGSFEELAKTARALGLDPKDMVAFGLDEEQIHIARGTNVSNLAELIAEEISTKSIARDFYVKMAKDSQGNPGLMRKYAILAALKEEDIRTTRKVYTQIHRKHTEDLEEIVEESEEQHSANSNREYVAQSGLAGNIVLMPKNKSKGKETDEKGKVVYGKFGKDYKGRSAETEGKDAESDAVSDAGTDASSKETDAKSESAEPGQAEASAEAA